MFNFVDVLCVQYFYPIANSTRNLCIFSAVLHPDWEFRTMSWNGKTWEDNIQLRISDIIRSNFQENTSMVVVLLGPNLANPPNRHFTHNWVTFEVGVAAGCRKPVLVLEEISHKTDFPIPYVTDYYQYELGNNEDRQNIGEVMKKIYQSKNNPRINQDVSIDCSHGDCNARYNLWMRYGNEINCPVCRRPMFIS